VLTGLALWLIVLLATFEPPPDAEGPSLGLTLIVASAMAACWAVEALLAWLALVRAMRRWAPSSPFLIAVAALHVVPGVVLRADSGWMEVMHVGPIALALATAIMLRRVERRGCAVRP
jgi:hypothetical protein